MSVDAAPFASDAAALTGFASGTVMSTSFPLKPSKAPFNTCIKPWPPESTTPACFNTGSISGVWLNT